MFLDVISVEREAQGPAVRLPTFEPLPFVRSIHISGNILYRDTRSEVNRQRALNGNETLSWCEFS